MAAVNSHGEKTRMEETENSQGNSVINYREYVYMKSSSDQTKVEISLLFHHDWGSHVPPSTSPLCAHTHTHTHTKQLSSLGQPPSPSSHLHSRPKAYYNKTSVNVSPTELPHTRTQTCMDTLSLRVSHTLWPTAESITFPTWKFHFWHRGKEKGGKGKQIDRVEYQASGTNRAFLGLKWRPTNKLTQDHADRRHWSILDDLLQENLDIFSLFWLFWSAKYFPFFPRLWKKLLLVVEFLPIKPTFTQ